MESAVGAIKVWEREGCGMNPPCTKAPWQGEHISEYLHTVATPAAAPHDAHLPETLVGWLGQQ